MATDADAQPVGLRRPSVPSRERVGRYVPAEQLGNPGARQRSAVGAVDDRGRGRLLPLLRGLGPVGRPLLHRGGREHRSVGSVRGPFRPTGRLPARIGGLDRSRRLPGPGGQLLPGLEEQRRLPFERARHLVVLPRRVQRRGCRADRTDQRAHHPGPTVGVHDRAARDGPARWAVAAVLLGWPVGDRARTPSPTPTARDRSGHVRIRTSDRSSDRRERSPAPVHLRSSPTAAERCGWPTTPGRPGTSAIPVAPAACEWTPCAWSAAGPSCSDPRGHRNR